MNTFQNRVTLLLVCSPPTLGLLNVQAGQPDINSAIQDMQGGPVLETPNCMLALCETGDINDGIHEECILKDHQAMFQATPLPIPLVPAITQSHPAIPMASAVTLCSL